MECASNYAKAPILVVFCTSQLEYHTKRMIGQALVAKRQRLVFQYSIDLCNITYYMNPHPPSPKRSHHPQPPRNLHRPTQGCNEDVPNDMPPKSEPNDQQPHQPPCGWRADYSSAPTPGGTSNEALFAPGGACSALPFVIPSTLPLIIPSECEESSPLLGASALQSATTSHSQRGRSLVEALPAPRNDESVSLNSRAFRRWGC